MKIGVIRHANVLHRDPLFSTGEKYNEGRIAYDAAEIAKVKMEIKIQDFPVCFVSARLRAIETAKMIYAGPIIIKEELVEVKNTAYFLLKLKLPSVIRAVRNILSANDHEATLFKQIGNFRCKVF